MPFAVALLCHPAGTFTALVVAIVAALYGVQSRRFLPSFTAAAAGSLALLAALQTPPSALGLVMLCAGIALLHAELLWPTFGIAGVLGLGSSAWAAWQLLAPLAWGPRALATLVGVTVIFAAVARTMRLRTLPSRRALP